MKVFHLINSLNRGGAEQMLLKLVSYTQALGMWENSVYSILPSGPLAPSFLDAGVRVVSTDGVGVLAKIRLLNRYRRDISRYQPDISQSWMYHSNLASSLVLSTCFGPKPKLVWNIRHSLHDLSLEKSTTQAVIRLGAWCSGSADAVLYNSEVSQHQHHQEGYSAHRSMVIANGFDLRRFSPMPEAGPKLKIELALPSSSILLGLVARFHPMKNQSAAIRAFASLSQSHPSAYFILAGRGVDDSNQQLRQVIEQCGAKERVYLLGELSDTSQLIAGLDALVMASTFGEGFPNVIGEAMACSVPVIATDVGDAAQIVGDAGILASSAAEADLAHAFGEFLRMTEVERGRLGQRGFDRVRSHYSIEAISQQYHQLYLGLLSDKKAPLEKANQ